MDTVSTYSFGNLAWLSTQAVPLIIWPSSIGALLRVEDATSSSLEAYFARSLGFALLALGLIVVLLSGAVPLGSEVDGKIISHRDGSSKLTQTAPQNGLSPYASAALTIAVLHHTAAACYTYSRYAWTGQTGFILGTIGSSFFAALGLYCIMFAGDKAMISRYHKFDQGTSGFPFKNKESYRSKKKAL
ncbi:uncharacterized protein F5Z01DRAFT_658343 [Emericellopsis atlantica]|uniref:Uncharacterized protein n=1 Tax=Emericellopsis atlantica TaxID=2614577 RepID=A0A9P7ZK80_9HYPO|nr:uncharacterized protein F5Z01DRAFT_658343 [Emericellopsis atlantica]KAG9253267.1 hypothetical protein F5Z01DRAFT_658343 [Emericellopsis atlantica]